MAGAIVERDGCRVLEFVCIRRKDGLKEWGLPGRDLPPPTLFSLLLLSLSLTSRTPLFFLFFSPFHLTFFHLYFWLHSFLLFFSLFLFLFCSPFLLLAICGLCQPHYQYATLVSNSASPFESFNVCLWLQAALSRPATASAAR